MFAHVRRTTPLSVGALGFSIARTIRLPQRTVRWEYRLGWVTVFVATGLLAGCSSERRSPAVEASIAASKSDSSSGTGSDAQTKKSGERWWEDESPSGSLKKQFSSVSNSPPVNAVAESPKADGTTTGRDGTRKPGASAEGAAVPAALPSGFGTLGSAGFGAGSIARTPTDSTGATNSGSTASSMTPNSTPVASTMGPGSNPSLAAPRPSLSSAPDANLLSGISSIGSGAPLPRSVQAGPAPAELPAKFVDNPLASSALFTSAPQRKVNSLEMPATAKMPFGKSLENLNAVDAPTLSSGGLASENNVEAAMAEGQRALRVGQVDEAVKCYERAVTLNPKLGEAFEGLANAYAARGDTALAIANFDNALRLDPERAEWYLARGILYSRMRRNQKAVDDTTAALRLNKKMAAALLWRAVAQFNENRFARAEADADAGLELEPGSLDFVYMRCVARLQQRKIEPARADFEQAVKMGLAGKPADELKQIFDQIPRPAIPGK